MAGRLNDADLRATIEGEVLGVVSGHGGERIVAGPEMYQLVQELTDLVLNWRADDQGRPSVPGGAGEKETT